MRRPQLIGEWVFLKLYSSEEYFKVKIIGEWSRRHLWFFKVLYENGACEHIAQDAISNIGEVKKARIVKFVRKLREVTPRNN